MNRPPSAPFAASALLCALAFIAAAAAAPFAAAPAVAAPSGATALQDTSEGMGAAGHAAAGPDLGLRVDMDAASDFPVPAPDGGLPPAVLFVSPRTGPFASLGRGAQLGARLAQRRFGGGTELIEAPEEQDAATSLGKSPGRIRAAAGHLFEGSLVESAPYYRRLGIPVLLPFIDSPGAAGLGPEFVPLFPSVTEQGVALAVSILDSRQRPPAVYILESGEAALGEFADAFERALRDPPPRGRQKRPALAKGVKVERVAAESVQDVAEFLETVKGNRKYAVLLAVPGPFAIRILPLLPESNLKSALFYGGAALAVRDVGAAWASLGFTLNLCVPAKVPDPKDAQLAEFANLYRQTFKTEPVWSSVSAYDAVKLALLAMATGDPMAYLSSPDGNAGIAGTYARDRPAPAAVIQVHRQAPESVAYLP
ncbi:MAG: ABC transporter substrate-binding protein [Deltaproteobacteria bacterium]|jgi:ABC-type branched-subunit amino acid transport system substrate-binding protein|nr:ABC transporter substrate-binding protein [Deltaproteobacteria bacterium]